MLFLYNKISDLCKSKNKNITQMCTEAKVPRSALSDYKSGKNKTISITNLQKIATYFDISIDDLVGNEKKSEKQPLTLDDFTYAMYEQSKELTAEDKKQLLRMAEFMRQQRGL